MDDIPSVDSRACADQFGNLRVYPPRSLVGVDVPTAGHLQVEVESVLGPLGFR